MKRKLLSIMGLAIAISFTACETEEEINSDNDTNQEEIDNSNKVFVGDDSYDVGYGYYCDEYSTNGDSLNYISILSTDWNTYQNLGNNDDFVAVQFILDSELEEGSFDAEHIVGYDIDYIVNGQQFEVSTESEDIDPVSKVNISLLDSNTYQIDYLFKSQGLEDVSGSYIGSMNSICN